MKESNYTYGLNDFIEDMLVDYIFCRKPGVVSLYCSRPGVTKLDGKTFDEFFGCTLEDIIPYLEDKNKEVLQKSKRFKEYVETVMKKT